MAHCVSFIKTLTSHKHCRLESYLTTSELKDARLALARVTQGQSFGREIRSLEQNDWLPHNTGL